MIASLKVELSVQNLLFNPWDLGMLQCLGSQHMKMLHLDAENETLKSAYSLHQVTIYICTTGLKFFNCLRIFRTAYLKLLIGVQEEERQWICSSWLVGGLLVVVDDCGNATIYQYGEVKDKFLIELNDEELVRTVVRKGNGFLVGGSQGTLAAYEACAARYWGLTQLMNSAFGRL